MNPHVVDDPERRPPTRRVRDLGSCRVGDRRSEPQPAPPTQPPGTLGGGQARRLRCVGVPARTGILLRHSPRDALLVGLALLHGALLVRAPSVPLVALGLWW